MPLANVLLDHPPYRLSGTVVAALLNDPAQLHALGDAARQPPHKAPPKAPVLAVRPRNTLAGPGDAVVVPAGATALQLGAGLAIVIGRTACRVPAAQALDCVAGYLVASDFSLPLEGHYRPATRLKARDGFCLLGPALVPAARVPRPDDLVVQVLLDGQPAATGHTGGRIRGVAALVADVSDFMTLQPGDVLLLGSQGDGVRVKAGQRVSVTVAGIGTLDNQLVSADNPGTDRARGPRLDRAPTP